MTVVTSYFISMAANAEGKTHGQASIGPEFVTVCSRHGPTDTLGGASLPVAVELAHAACHPSEFVASVAVVLAPCTVVVAVRGAAEGAVGGWKECRASPHCKEGRKIDR